MVTTTNEFNQQVFKSKITLTEILTFAIIKGIDECEKLIKNTYCKKEQTEIINSLNSFLQFLN
jgi:hypothetical protein